MPDIDPKRLTSSRRAGVLAAATLVSAVLAAGCGGSRSPTTAASSGRGTTAGSGTAVGGRGTGSGSTASGAVGSRPLAFADCMRANGVPNFPDPNPGGGFNFRAGSGIDPYAPAVQAAQAKCQKFMPNPLTRGPAFSARSFAKVVKVAQCMRNHGISEFPDPTTTRPSFSPGVRVITDYDGAYLVFPTTLDMQSPAYTRAASACGVLAQKLGNGPHAP